MEAAPASSSGGPAGGAPAVDVDMDDVPVQPGQGDDVAMGSLTVLLASLGSWRDAIDVAEVFCPGRLREFASLFDVNAGGAYDLRTGWNLSDVKQRQECKAELAEQLPNLVVGSPKCLAFSVLQALNPASERYQIALHEGIEHLTEKGIWYQYNGRHPHWTEDFEGDRWSIVAYKKPKPKSSKGKTQK